MSLIPAATTRTHLIQRLLAVLGLLVLGVITTHVVAWVCLFRQWQPIQLAKARREFASMRFVNSDPPPLLDSVDASETQARPRASVGGVATNTNVPWPCPVPADWPHTPSECGQDELPTIRRAMYRSFVLAPGASNTGFGAWVTADEIACGWPWLGTRGVHCRVSKPPVRLVTSWPSEPRSSGVIMLRNNAAEIAPHERPEWLPVGVRPGAFAANTVVYAAAWALVLFAFRGFAHVFRMFKRKPWMCRKCRYDLSGLPAGCPCPECGHALTP